MHTVKLSAPRAACTYRRDGASWTHDGPPLKFLTVVDEYTRECLAIRLEGKMAANDVLWLLANLFL